MLTFKSLAITLFKILIASYFISHGLNLSHNVDSFLPLLQNSLTAIPGFPFTVTPQYAQIYAHLEVVIGIVILMGWTTGRMLGFLAYLINCCLLSGTTDRITIGKEFYY